MTSLRDEVAAYSRPVRMECTVKTFLKTRPADEDWDAMFADPELTSHGIWKAMTSRGYRHSEQAVSRHRREGCACVRPA